MILTVILKMSWNAYQIRNQSKDEEKHKNTCCILSTQGCEFLKVNKKIFVL